MRGAPPTCMSCCLCSSVYLCSCSSLSQEKESELCGVRVTLVSLAEEGDHLKHTLHTAQDNM